MVDNLDYNVMYQFRVVAASGYRDTQGQLVFSGVEQAGDASGDQKTSNIVTAVPVLPLTIVPSGLRVTGVKSDEISVAWDQVVGATYYQIEYQLASLAYEPMTQWSTYGTPPAHILDTRVTIPIDPAQSGKVFNVRVSAFNAHLKTNDYPGFVGPSVSVQARPVAPPSPPALLSIHPAAARILYRGMAQVTAESEVHLLDGDAVARGQLGRQAVVGARLEIMDGSYRGAIRQVAGYSSSSAALSLSSPLRPADLVPDVEKDIYASAAIANKTYVRLSREASSEESVVLGWAAVRDARQYHLQVRYTDELHLAGRDLAVQSFAEIATVSSR